jgi:hypothetical protein
VKADYKQSNRRAGNFSIYRKQEENGRGDLSSHWLSWDRKKPLVSHTTTERTNRRKEQEFRMALKRGAFAGLGRRLGEDVRVCWAGNRRVRDRGMN